MERLQDRIGYHFHELGILRQALTHSSYTNEITIREKEDNERLEFLGDAVLQLVSSILLYKRYPDKPEGELTKLRASIVCEASLAHTARKIELGRYLLLGRGLSVANVMEKDSIISDALEALIGAIFLDGGLDDAKIFINEFVLPNLNEGKILQDNKTILQELVQGKGMSDVTYQTVKETGPDHNKTFTIMAYIGGKKMGCGQGKTKKSAEQEAAYQTIQMLKEI